MKCNHQGLTEAIFLKSREAHGRNETLVRAE